MTQNREKKKNRLWFLFLPLSAVYMELVFRAFCIGSWSVSAVLVSAAFALALGCLFNFIALLGSARWFRVSSSVLLAATWLFFGVHTVYKQIFNQYLGVGLMGVGGAAITDFWRETLTGIWQSLPALLLLAAPFALWLAFGRRMTPHSTGRRRALVSLAAFLVLQIGASASVRLDKRGAVSSSFLYGDGFVLDSGVTGFGLITAQRLDVQHRLGLYVSLERKTAEPAATPAPTAEPVDTASDAPAATPTPTPTPEIIYDAHVSDLDLAAMAASEKDAELAELTAWLAGREPTCENEYTGMFEGKNLVWLCGESFSSWAIDETHTPTLYKLANEGFVFDDFYVPLTSASTTGGEFMTLLGMYQNTTTELLRLTADNYLPYAAGNVFSALGYKCLAYHNGTYTYYGRDVTMPNLGFEFKAKDHGMEAPKDYVLSLDYDMLRATAGEYIGSEPFCVYYMTISGHFNYTFLNYDDSVFEDEVKDLTGATYGARAYVAGQMQVDRALEYLIDELEAAGELDNTVIVLSADHYPYALGQNDIESLTGRDMDGRFDLEKSTLILWCADMDEPVEVTKPCSSSDILPTLLNLFGVDYDSRLILGHDILSTAGGFVPFIDYSFVSSDGSYDATRDVYTRADGTTASGDEAAAGVARVREYYKYSSEMVYTDFYDYIFG